MKRLISLMSILLFLTACKSTETKIEETVHEDLAEQYNINEVEVTSIEPENLQVPFIVFALARLAGGKDYEVKIEVNETVTTEMTGKVNGRELDLKHNDYVTQKHQKLEEVSESYQNVLDDLHQEGITVEKITEGYASKLNEEGIRLLHFDMELEKETFDAEKVYDLLTEMSEHILENIDSEIELELTMSAENQYAYADSTEEEIFEIEMLHDDDRSVFDQLKNTMVAADLQQKFDQEMIKKIEALDLTPVQSKFANRSDTVETEFIHEILIEDSEDIDDEKILKLAELLREEGFEQSYLEIFSVSAGYEFVQVEDIRSLRDAQKHF